MRKAASAFVPVLVLTVVLLVSRQTPHVAEAQGADKRGTGYQQARISLSYEKTIQETWDHKSLGQTFDFGHRLETRKLRAVIVLEVPDEDLLQPLELRGVKTYQGPRETQWLYSPPEDGRPGMLRVTSFSGRDDARIRSWAGSVEYSQDEEYNDKKLRTMKEWRWCKKTREAHGARDLTSEGAGTDWQARFSSADGLQGFGYHVSLPVTRKEVYHDKTCYLPGAVSDTTTESLETVELALPPPEEKGWVFNRSFDSRGMQASGTFETSSSDNVGNRRVVHESYRVEIDLDPAEYECVITPPNGYREWRPLGGKNEEQVGSTLQFTGEIRCKKGHPAPDRTFWVKARVASSTQPGVCLNFPTKGKKSADLIIQREGTSKELDLKSDEGTGADDAWTTAEGNVKLGQKFSVTVASRDYGAFGAITFEGNAPVRIEGFDKRGAGLDLPFDENHDHIADDWARVYWSRGAADADEDTLPESVVAGDGLSAYEEYRGFVCSGVWGSTNPWVKDLFVYDRNNLGLGLFRTSGLALHLVRADEFYEWSKEDGVGTTNTHVINPNGAYAHLGTQHLLYLRDQDLGDGLIGRAEGWGDPGPPREISFVNVNAAACKEFGPEELGATIAHELGHGCNVWHHGDTDYYGVDVKSLGLEGDWRESPMGEGLVATVGGQNSGVESCVMRYSADFYVEQNGRWSWRTPDGERVRGELYPKRRSSPDGFCTRREGTGTNDAAYPGGPIAGDATLGNCRHQFQVNDLKPANDPTGKP